MPPPYYYVVSALNPDQTAERSKNGAGLWTVITVTDITSSEKNCPSRTSAEILSLAKILQPPPMRRNPLPECWPNSTSCTTYLAYKFTAEHPDAIFTDQLPRFCIDFVLTLMDNNNITTCFAMFLHDLCHQFRKLDDELTTVDLDDIGYRLGDRLVVGFLQFKTSSIRDIYEWVRTHASFWINPSYGVVYYDTNSCIVTEELLRMWKSVVDVVIQ